MTGWEDFRTDVQDAVVAGTDDHLDRLGWDEGRIVAHQRDGLRRLLAHAVERSPFHRRRLAGLDVDRVDPTDLTALPVMTKAEMMASFDDVVTDRRLTRDRVEQALAGTRTEPVVMVTTPAVLDYQVRQTPRGIDLHVVTAEPPDADADLDLDALVDRLAAALTHAGLPHPDVTARTVASLDRHPHTGKLRRFVPLATTSW